MPVDGQYKMQILGNGDPECWFSDDAVINGGAANVTDLHIDSPVSVYNGSDWFTVSCRLLRPTSATATAEISVYVSPAAQGGGIGRRLVLHALERTPALGLSTLVGFVFAHNAPSVALFEGLRFARWGHLPRVARLDGVERDLLILGRRLD